MSKTLMVLIVLAANVWLLWAAVIGFTGGNLPLTPIHLDGGAVIGVLFLVLGLPVCEAVLMFLANLIVLPVIALEQRTQRSN